MMTYRLHALPVALADAVARGLEEDGLRPVSDGTPDLFVLGIAAQDAEAALEDVGASAWLDLVCIPLAGGHAELRATGTAMARRGSGKIVIVCDAAGLRGQAERPAASAVSGAAIALTKTLGRELAPHGVRVNAIATPCFSVDDAASSAPRPGDISEAVRYLADPTLTSLVGQVLPCTAGGYRARV